MLVLFRRSFATAQRIDEMFKDLGISCKTHAFVPPRLIQYCRLLHTIGREAEASTSGRHQLQSSHSSCSLGLEFFGPNGR